MNNIIPPICSSVHSFGNKANERKMVVAFRAVDVMDIVNAPNDFVIAAEQLELKNPVAEKRINVNSFDEADHVGVNPSSISFNVPGCVR
jgi:hypothetical protein